MQHCQDEGARFFKPLYNVREGKNLIKCYQIIKKTTTGVVVRQLEPWVKPAEHKKACYNMKLIALTFKDKCLFPDFKAVHSTKCSLKLSSSSSSISLNLLRIPDFIYYSQQVLNFGLSDYIACINFKSA
jgi:hypothetical protein